MMRGGVVSLGADWACVEVPFLDVLPLNRTLYISLSTFAYSSNHSILKSCFDQIDFMSASGPFKN